MYTTVVDPRFRLRKCSLFSKSENWHTHRKRFSSDQPTAELDIGDFNRTQFTKLNLVKNSKTSWCFRLPPQLECTKQHGWGRWHLKVFFFLKNEKTLYFTDSTVFLGYTEREEKTLYNIFHWFWFHCISAIIESHFFYFLKKKFERFGMDQVGRNLEDTPRVV